MIAFEMRDYALTISPEVWGLLPFKAILKRDKSRNKEQAFKEMLFVYYYSDLRSDYLHILDDSIRTKEIVKDIGLDKNFKIDKVIQEAIYFYQERSLTVTERLYKSALKSANDVAKYLENTDVLLSERTNSGGTVTKINDITAAQKQLPDIMRNLRATYKEVLAEKNDTDGKMKGSKKLGLYEMGLNFEEK